nr:MAG TPA: hypothetical protein [Caudoviricetes sp.]
MIKNEYESLVRATYADEWIQNVLKLIRTQKSDKAKQTIIYSLKLTKKGEIEGLTVVTKKDLIRTWKK